MFNQVNGWSSRALAALRIVAGLLFLAHGVIKVFGFPAGAEPGQQELLSLFGIGGVIELITGLLLIQLAGLSVTTEWVLTALIIFLCVGSLWLPVLVLQKRLQSMALSAGECSLPLDDRYASTYRWWFWMGVAGFAGMFVIVLMMVTKMTPVQLFSFLL